MVCRKSGVKLDSFSRLPHFPVKAKTVGRRFDFLTDDEQNAVDISLQSQRGRIIQRGCVFGHHDKIQIFFDAPSINSSNVPCCVRRLPCELNDAFVVIKTRINDFSSSRFKLNDCVVQLSEFIAVIDERNLPRRMTASRIKSIFFQSFIRL
jgi:hypothetical protein